MRRTVFAAILMVLLTATLAKAQTPPAPERPVINVEVTAEPSQNGGPVEFYVLDFSSPIFEHDDVQTCREYRMTASELIKAVCDATGVVSAEFNRYSIRVRGARISMLQGTVVPIVLTTMAAQKSLPMRVVTTGGLVLGFNAIRQVQGGWGTDMVAEPNQTSQR